MGALVEGHGRVEKTVPGSQTLCRWQGIEERVEWIIFLFKFLLLRECRPPDVRRGDATQDVEIVYLGWFKAACYGPTRAVERWVNLRSMG